MSGLDGGSGAGLPAGSKVLVTGGFGFLGGHVLEELLQQDVIVHVVDDLSSNPVPLDTLLDELGHPPGLTWDVTTVAEYMREGPGEFDWIIHLASVVGPAGILAHGGRIVSSIVDDTYLLADYALEHGARFLDVSTSEAYGGGREGLCSEDDDKIVSAQTSFRLEYAVAKLAAETALINLQARDGLDVVIVRPFNIAGPRQSGEGGFVLPRFLSQALFGLPLTVFGSGEAKRAFSHVKDMADGVLRALVHGTPGTAYNLGNHENVTTVEGLADSVLAVTESDSQKQFIDPREIYGPTFAEANDKFPAAGRAVSELGWQPAWGIDAIVRDAWEYLRAADPDVLSALAGSKVIDDLVAQQSTAESH